jgi:hypothetical protein
MGGTDEPPVRGWKNQPFKAGRRSMIYSYAYGGITW